MAGNVTVLGEASQRDNDPHRLDYIRRDATYPTVAPRAVGYKDIVAYGAVLVPAWFIILLVLWVVYAISTWGAHPWDRWTLSVWIMYSAAMFWTFGLPLALAIVWPATLLWQRIARTRVEVARAAIVPDRYSNPVHVALLAHKPPEQAWRELQLATQAEITMAPHKQLPAGLDSNSMTYHYSISGGAPTAAAQLTAPAAEEPNTPLPMATWLPHLADAYHLMLAAETGSGKSTLAKTIIAERIKAGDKVVVIDPHGSTWFALKRYGAGRNYVQVRQALKAVSAEMDERYRQRERGQQTFERLTVLIDEVPAIYENDITRNTWKSFARSLGSEARKVNISIMFMTQSPLVQDVGINTSMQRNFSLVALDMPCIIKLVRAYDQDRSMIEVLRGQEYPAAAAFKSDVHILDRSKMLLDPTDPGGDYAWPLVLQDDDEDAAPPRRRSAMPAVAHRADSGDVVRASHNVMHSIVHNTLSEPQRDEIVRILFRKGKTYREVRDNLAKAGLQIDQNRLTALRDEALKNP